MSYVPPEVPNARKLLLAVVDLHLRGYQRLRVLPYVGSVGAWRCIIAPAHLVSARYGGWLANSADEEKLPRYTGADGCTYWGWHDTHDAPPARLARVFLEKFPQVAQAGFGPG